MAQTETIKPKADGTFEVKKLLVTDVNASLIFDLRGGSWDYMTIQAVADGTADLTSLVNKVRISNDGATPIDFTTGAVTLSTATITAPLTISATNFVHLTFTTAGTGGYVSFHARVSRARGVA